MIWNFISDQIVALFHWTILLDAQHSSLCEYTPEQPVYARNIWSVKDCQGHNICKPLKCLREPKNTAVVHYLVQCLQLSFQSGNAWETFLGGHKFFFCMSSLSITGQKRFLWKGYNKKTLRHYKWLWSITGHFFLHRRHCTDAALYIQQ